MSNLLFIIKLAISFLPFILFAFFNGKANIKKENRSKQYAMPVIAVIYSIVLLIFLDQFATLFMDLFLKLAGLFDKIKLAVVVVSTPSLRTLKSYTVPSSVSLTDMKYKS